MKKEESLKNFFNPKTIAVIGADVITPKIWAAYGAKAKIPYIALAMDPVGSEKLTITFAIDDENILTEGRTPTGSPYTVSGNKHDLVIVPTKVVAERIQIRIVNNTADAVYSLKAVGIPGRVLTPAIR